MKTKSLIALGAAALAFLPADTEACTRAVYLGPEGMIVTGRTMDWREDPLTNLYIFPRGAARRGADSDNTVFWTSKYGTLSAAGYDIGITDGMNEAGLVANLLFLPESIYERPGDTRPVMGLSIWTQYVLDNFATVDEAVAAVSKGGFEVVSDQMPDGSRLATLHLSISDTTGDNAIFEYVGGKLNIHHSKAYQVMTNSPVFDQQLALDDYWRTIGGTTFLPGTNRAADRFVRASFYIDAIPKVKDSREAVAAVFSVIRNCSVPLGISTPGEPNISSTRWRTLSDQKSKIYFYESAFYPNIFWVDFKDVDFSPGAPVKMLDLNHGKTYAGNTAAEFVATAPFHFLGIE